MTREIRNIFKSKLGFQVLVRCIEKDITPLEIANRLDLSPQTISKYLRNLRNKNLIKREIKGRHGYYNINKDKLLTLWIKFNSERNENIESILSEVFDNKKNFQKILVRIVYWIGDIENRDISFGDEYLERVLSQTFWDVLLEIHEIPEEKIKQGKPRKMLKKLQKLDKKMFEREDEGLSKVCKMIIKAIEEVFP